MLCQTSSCPTPTELQLYLHCRVDCMYCYGISTCPLEQYWCRQIIDHVPSNCFQSFDVFSRKASLHRRKALVRITMINISSYEQYLAQTTVNGYRMVLQVRIGMLLRKVILMQVMCVMKVV